MLTFGSPFGGPGILFTIVPIIIIIVFAIVIGGIVVEGDAGYAAVQGDWIVGFERDA